ncbi:hypothetical protein [Caldibacillus debilis]|uniref:Uncharacterized protein n=1 Tax=Caldibacillus debilis TaxID=301148 RepID=A0A150L9X2_9BACI|nr:hypothetical protein [Caldibacillus debilis]KYD08796.1 hypothetical protein B4135_0478 [Caldibacillus debilis]
MKPFIGLVKKELLLARYWYLTSVIFMALIFLAAFLLGLRYDMPTAFVPFYMLSMIFLLFFMPAMLLSLLRVEGRTQLWLYNPQPSSLLLLGKLAAAFLFQLLSHLLFILAGILFNLWLEKHGFSPRIPIGEAFSIHLLITGVAVIFSLWSAFLWTVYHSLGKYPRLKHLRWLIVSAIFLLYCYIESRVMKLDFVHKWMEPSVKVSGTPSLYFSGKGWSVEIDHMPISVGGLIYFILLSLLLFYGASKLLDKKVEV